MRAPNASPRMPATFAATSMPTSSSSAIGPIGIPKSTIALSSDSIVFPSSSRNPDSFNDGLAQLARERGNRGRGDVRCQTAANDFDERHAIHRIEEVHADDVLRPVRL